MPSATPSPQSPPSSTASTAASPAAGALPAATATRSPAARGSRSTCTCTPRTRTTARSRFQDLLDHAESIGLGAIAITDHNRFGGALEAQELARHRKLTVIPGEEVKTDNQGEVIGLFLQEEIPRGLTFAETIEAIRAQNALVYLPHPFDRMHAIPDPRTLHRHLADIDVFEVYNARLMRESFNAEALRFARKYDLTMGAGSDAHVLLGVGTGALKMRAFNGPEEFLVSLRGAEILRRPKSLIVQQVQKWAAQAKERSAKRESHPAPSDRRAYRRDPREVPAEGDCRDQRAR